MMNNQNSGRQQHGILKTAIVGVVAGLIGGGASYVALDQINNANMNNNAQIGRASCRERV